MKKGRTKYIVLISIAFLMTPALIDVGYETRQAFAPGGEWLLVPVAILMGLVVDKFKEIIG